MSRTLDTKSGSFSNRFFCVNYRHELTTPNAIQLTMFDFAHETVEHIAPDYYREMLDANRSLLTMVDPREWSSGEVGLAGGCALYWHLIHEAFPKDLLDWVPSDIDLFVCGELGSTHSKFRAYVEECKERCTEFGVKVLSTKFHKNRYVIKNQSVLIADLEIAGLDSVISFVQAPNVRTVMEVVETFDIDVVQVVYNCFTCEFTIEPGIKERIANMHAIVKPFHTEKHCPSEFEKRRQSVTYYRMKKYEKRHFVFINSPCIISHGYAHVSSSHMEMLEQKRLSFNHTIFDPDISSADEQESDSDDSSMQDIISVLPTVESSDGDESSFNDEGSSASDETELHD